MRNHTLAASMTVFLIFFGIALFDALMLGHWMSALFWLLIGALFLVLGSRKTVNRRA